MKYFLLKHPEVKSPKCHLHLSLVYLLSSVLYLSTAEKINNLFSVLDSKTRRQSTPQWIPTVTLQKTEVLGFVRGPMVLRLAKKLGASRVCGLNLNADNWKWTNCQLWLSMCVQLWLEMCGCNCDYLMLPVHIIKVLTFVYRWINYLLTLYHRIPRIVLTILVYIYFLSLENRDFIQS